MNGWSHDLPVSTHGLLIMTTLGWVGALGTVAAYALVSQRRMDAHSLRFQAINTVGAGMLAISAMGHHSWPSAASNLLWAFFGTQALVNARELWRPGAARHWNNAKAHVVALRHPWGHPRRPEPGAADDWTTAA
jgi:hypothetical protein